jgi:hypothetical protein
VGIGAGYGDASSASVPLAAHWDGSTWTDVEVPLVANRHHALTGVAMIASDDVWAVGDYRNIAGVFRGVTYHWEGSAWSHVYSPIEDVSQSGLGDVEALGPDDVWAIGGSELGPVVMHWDGNAWNLIPPPPNSGDAIAPVGPNDVWVSGWNGFFHWDGVSWTEVLAPVPGASYVIRSGGMEIVGDCDIWSVGFWTLADGITSYTLAERLQPPATAAPTFGAEGLGLSFANPFRPGGSIRMALPEPQPARLAIYDLQGRLVRSLPGGTSESESQAVTWDGRGDAGLRLPAGMYIVKLESGGRQTSRKLILLGGAGNRG